MLDFNIGDQVQFGSIERGYSSVRPKRRSRYIHNGVVEGWQNRGQIVVKDLTSNKQYILKQRKSGNYILVGDTDESDKWTTQPLRHLNADLA